jgi:uncharacterized protein
VITYIPLYSGTLGGMLLPTTLFTGLVIGLAVGSVGGGGAVLALPVLVYVVGLDVHEATTVSLAVVTGAGTVGAIAQSQRGAVCWASAAWFAGAAAVGSVAGTVVNGAVGGSVLLVAFSLVMLLASRATWQRAAQPAADVAGCPGPRPRMLVPLGIGVGIVTGLVGVGGGFVVVPALALGLSFGMREAMGTSMAVVAIVSACALASHLIAGGRFDVPVALTMGAAAAAGAFAGPLLVAGVSARRLGRGFALLMALVAMSVLAAALIAA